ncbi:MAG: FMN-binding glutamate synthase family protein [Pirellulaceae bacterium]
MGTGYFGCRNEQGRFDEKKFVDVVQANSIRAVEVKLSQGAKPGLGGLLPAAKVTPQIARIRGIPVGKDCASPSSHAEFSNVDQLLDFVERLADLSGLPIGIKSAVGESRFWQDLAGQIASSGRSVDFITIDGGEGGTAAAPLAFSDHVALPFKLAFARVYPEFVRQGLHERIVFIGSGKLGFPESGLFAMALGCDTINVGREGMLAIGCIQAQRCHTGHCPAGVATQNKWLTKGLHPDLKAERLANYVSTLRKELTQLSHACGVEHPALVTAKDFDILDESFGAKSAATCFGYEDGWGLPSAQDQEQIKRLTESAAG